MVSFYQIIKIKTKKMNKQRLYILTIGILGAIGTFLPWASVPLTGNIYGTEGDGWITLFLFLVPVLFSLIKDRTKNLNGGFLIASIISSLIASVIGVYDLLNFKSLKAELGELLTIGPGLYVIIVTGILLPIVAFIVKNKE